MNINIFVKKKKILSVHTFYAQIIVEKFPKYFTSATYALGMKLNRMS